MAFGKLKILMDHDLDHVASPDRSAVLENCRVETWKWYVRNNSKSLEPEGFKTARIQTRRLCIHLTYKDVLIFNVRVL
jgi:hypothetical protein